ncbi:Uncharacterised protein [Mycobacteroides abscessus subsp. abscessus]|nr:Uncharacterised protein [Mycobacteroides abscessus subsp. abscessus]SKW02398.1 Uncharacterised protein [Mycobacteroides abscessus subsp. abscessus]
MIHESRYFMTSISERPSVFWSARLSMNSAAPTAAKAISTR